MTFKEDKKFKGTTRRRKKFIFIHAGLILFQKLPEVAMVFEKQVK